MEAALWVVLAIALAIAEMFTATLLVIMFAAGALAAGGAAALGAPLLVQSVVFAAVSMLSLVGARPIILSHQRSALESGGTALGIEAIEGASAVVLEEVDGERGLVKIDGEMWTARSFDGAEVYPAGEHVQVVKIRGVTAFVWRDGMPHA